MEYKKITVDFSSTTAGGTRRRSKSDAGSAGSGAQSIRVRPPPRPRDMNRTMKRNALLKFIRRHQDNNYQKMMSEDAHTAASAGTSLSEEAAAKSDLDDTLDYLMGLSDTVKLREEGRVLAPSSGVANHTLKRTTSGSSSSSPYVGRPWGEGMTMPPHEQISLEFPSSSTAPPVQLNPPAAGLHPNYGCLKGGQLPTYRTFMRETAAVRAPRSQVDPEVSQYNVHADTEPTHTVQNMGQMGGATGETTLAYVRQKRTNRRTYKLGKSPTYPKVGVLISNRTIRKNITTQSHHLKQTPMHEIRKFLVQHGLIKIGTTAPNEVLRKMFESSRMLCGEVYNHNTDVLLHNFLTGNH